MSILLYAGGVILLVLFLLAAAAALFLLYRKRYLAGGSLLAALLVLLAGGAYGAGQFRASAEKSVQDQLRSYDESTQKEAGRDYEEALSLLGAAKLNSPDRRSLETAVRDLESVDSSLGEDVAVLFPDVPVLTAYAKLMLAVSSHEDGLTEQVAAKDAKMAEALAQIPEGYQGRLAEKIMPVRQVLLAMKAAGEKQARRDAEDLERHQQKMKQGEYGLIAPGDPESKLRTALGEPSYVNEGQDGQDMRQYVFQHHSRRIYVYTKNGIVTEVRGL